METQPEIVYKKVKAPLSTEEMKEAFLNKGKIKYIIDYKNSSLKTDVLLMFLSNLELDPEFDLDGVVPQEKFDFIATYMKSKALISSQYLAYAVINILLSYRKFNWEPIFPRVLTDEEITQFISKQGELVEKWASFIDSTLLVLIRGFDPQISLDEYDEVPDMQIGMNVVNLLQMPVFYDAFIGAGSGTDTKLRWYTQQFETSYFKGRQLITYLCDKKNTIFLGMTGLANGLLTPEMLSDVAKELDELEGPHP